MKEILTGSVFIRIGQIHATLSNEERCTAETLSAELGVSVRTVRRDLDTMRDALGLPVEWDAGEHSFVYTSPVTALPLLRLNPREALALAMVGRVGQRWAGSALGRMIGAMFDKVAPIFGDAVSVKVDSVSRVLSSAQVVDDRELEHFVTLLEAILDRREVRLDYTNAKADKPERRVVHPLHLAEREQGWLLVAFDPGRMAARKFVLARMRAVNPTGATFAPPEGFDLERYLADSLGRFAGTEEHDVRIALDAHAAFYASEKPWHPAQELIARAEGGAVLAMRVNHLADVLTSVLRWGEHAEVLEPAELREQVRASLKAALAKYDR